MKVIFLKDMRNVARRDEIKEVSDGYALNALIPQGIAVQATPEMVKSHAVALNTRAQTEAAQDRHLAEQAAKLEGTLITVKEKANDLGHLYHQLAPKVIIEALKRECNIALDTNAIHVGDPIRSTGDFRIEVRRGKSIAHVTVRVVGTK